MRYGLDHRRCIGFAKTSRKPHRYSASRQGNQNAGPLGYVRHENHRGVNSNAHQEGGDLTGQVRRLSPKSTDDRDE